MSAGPRNLIVAISGASGALYGRALLRALAVHDLQSVQLIVSPAALRVYNQELNREAATPAAYLAECLAPAEVPARFLIQDYHDIGARAASGSAPSDGMIVAPCSMKSLAAIAHGHSSNLLERAAEVCLKERRRLVLVPRETPYSLLQLRNMTALTEAGAIILPASPAFYQAPQNFEDLACFIVGRALALFGIDHRLFPAWNPS
ncbi:MAG: UbiX family flavin prenyltransferase [Leptospirales bacterium]|nr:UbiX family flavin prenyltransferase [Leptospirales bacterium]